MTEPATPPAATPAAPEAPAKKVRPRDAASVVLYRRQGGQTQVLMGLRHAKHKFMPQRWVFPGGRVDAGDSRVPLASPLRPAVAARLARCAPSEGRARALAVAAVRETFEEVGLILGKPANGALKGPVPEAWRGFLDRGLAPALDGLDLIFRAITPVYSPRRFHARFFLADADKAEGELKGSGELEDLRWLTLEEAFALPLVDVTEECLRNAAKSLASPELLERTDPVPMFCYRGRSMVLRRA